MVLHIASGEARNGDDDDDDDDDDVGLTCNVTCS